MPKIPPTFGGVPSAKNPDYVTGVGYTGPFAPDYDPLFIAPVHYALVACAGLIAVGHMAPVGLEMFNQVGSSVEMIGAEHRPGMEAHNGTLGSGLSAAAGLAWGRKRRGEAGGGGMSVERAGEMARIYGPEVVDLLGGSLLRHWPAGSIPPMTGARSCSFPSEC